jgi:hypothetical protein
MTDSTLLSQTPARRMQGCIGEYERIRRRESTAFKTVRDFCICHRFSRRNFMKIYRRYRQAPSPGSPVPQRRGRSTVRAVSTCKPENESSIFAGSATTAVKYGIYCGKMLPLFPARVEVIEDKKALTVMFATLKALYSQTAVRCGS